MFAAEPATKPCSLSQIPDALKTIRWRTTQFAIKISETTTKSTYQETFVHYMYCTNAEAETVHVHDRNFEFWGVGDP